MLARPIWGNIYNGLYTDVVCNKKKDDMSIKIIIYFSILFFLSELILVITKHSKKQENKTKNDKKSLILFWITIPISLTIGFFTANYQEWNTLNYSIAIFGLCAFTVGIIIRWISIIQLGKGFTVDVTITKTHSLKTDGIYKNIRHPSYLGLLLILFGLSISMNSLISFFIISIPIYFAVIYRMKIEESVLSKEFGDIYKNYKLHTCKIFPRLY